MEWKQDLGRKSFEAEEDTLLNLDDVTLKEEENREEGPREGNV